MQPYGSFGRSLKIWYYLVFGFDVGTMGGATAGGGIIRFPPGLIVDKGLIITGIVGVWEIGKGILTVGFSSF